MDDRVDAVERAAQALGVRDVAFRELRALRLELCATVTAADEDAHLLVVRAERADDVPADEPGAAGHEDHVAKFFQ
jgi:hypothetical protein